MYNTLNAAMPYNDWGRLLRVWIRAANVQPLQPDIAATNLYVAAKGAGTDENVFIQIMSTSSPQAYQMIAQCFQNKYNKTLRDVIKREFAAKSEYAFLLAHDFLMNPL